MIAVSDIFLQSLDLPLKGALRRGYSFILFSHLTVGNETHDSGNRAKLEQLWSKIVSWRGNRQYTDTVAIISVAEMSVWNLLLV